MDEEIERLVVGVRADTMGFAADVARMRAELDGPLAAGADRAGRALEVSLARAIRTGRLGFDDLKRVALSALAEIAAASVSKGIGALLGGQTAGGGIAGVLAGLIGGGRPAGGGLVAAGTTLLGGILGLPGRATGGPVSPGRAYLVGERGPEMFVPTASGRVEAGGTAAPREVRVSIRIDAAAGAAPQALAQSSRQVARAVRRAIEAAER